MRELVLKMSMSLDGFVSAANGDNGWMFSGDPAAVAWSAAMVGEARLHIMGRATFETMARHWPGAAGPFAAPMNRIPKAVFTRGGFTPPALPRAESWAGAQVAAGPLADEVAALKRAPGGPVLAHGGAGFARSLIAENLVDRYELLVHPIALGGGSAIFDGLPAPRRLALIGTRPFPGGAVAQTYRPA